MRRGASDRASAGAAGEAAAAQLAPADGNQRDDDCKQLPVLEGRPDPGRSLSAADAAALVAAARVPQSRATLEALKACANRAAACPLQAQQLIAAGIVRALLGHICPTPGAQRSPGNVRSGAWECFVEFAIRQPDATAAAVAAAGDGAFQRLVAAVAGAALSPEGNFALGILANIVSADPSAAASISADNPVIEAAVAHTYLLLQVPPRGGVRRRLIGLAALQALVDPTRNPQGWGEMVTAPNLADIALEVLSASESSAGQHISDGSVDDALQVLMQLMAANGDPETDRCAASAVEATAAAGGGGGALIRYILRLLLHTEPCVAMSAAGVCKVLSPHAAGRKALLRQPSLLTTLVAAVCRMPPPAGPRRVVQNKAAWGALATLQECMAPSQSEEEDIRRSVLGMAPAVAAQLLPRAADVVQEFQEGMSSAMALDKAEWAMLMVGPVASVTGALVEGCAAAGQLSEAAAAPRAMHAVARFVLAAIEEDRVPVSRGDSSSGAGGALDAGGGDGASSSGGSSREAEAHLLDASSCLLDGARVWVDACRAACSGGAAPCWDPDEMRALLAAAREVLAWVEGRPAGCEEAAAAAQLFRASLADWVELAAAGPGEDLTLATAQLQLAAGQGQQQHQQQQQQQDGAPAEAPACATCGSASGPGGSILKRCKGCRSPFPKYCSVACYEAGWPAHKAACRAAQRAAARGQQQQDKKPPQEQQRQQQHQQQDQQPQQQQ